MRFDLSLRFRREKAPKKGVQMSNSGGGVIDGLNFQCSYFLLFIFPFLMSFL